MWENLSCLWLSKQRAQAKACLEGLPDQKVDLRHAGSGSSTNDLSVSVSLSRRREKSRGEDKR